MSNSYLTSVDICCFVRCKSLSCQTVSAFRHMLISFPYTTTRGFLMGIWGGTTFPLISLKSLVGFGLQILAACWALGWEVSLGYKINEQAWNWTSHNQVSTFAEIVLLFLWYRWRIIKCKYLGLKLTWFLLGVLFLFLSSGECQHCSRGGCRKGQHVWESLCRRNQELVERPRHPGMLR